MKYSKYIFRAKAWGGALLAGAVFALSLSGCSRSPLDGGEGTLSLGFQQDDAVTVKGAVRNDVGYTLDITDQKGDTVAHYDDHRTVLSIKLKEGVYTVHAEDNTETPETSKFGEPRYGGSQSVTIVAGQNTPVLMTCKLINVKVQVTSFEQAIKDNFTEYSLVVKPTEDYAKRDTLTFTQADVDAGEAGWINQTKKGEFVVIFRAVNRQSPEKRQIYIRTIADALPADFYRFEVKMNPVGNPSDGGTMFRLSVKTDMNEYEFPFGVKDQTKPLPVVSRADGISIREPLMTNVDLRDAVAKLDIHAEAGIQRLRIRHEDPNVLLKYGLPGMITLGGDNDAATDEAQRPGLADVVTWKEGTMVGEIDTWVDFSGLLNTKALNGVLLPEGLYPVDIEIYDYDNQMVTQRVTLSVARDFSTGGALTTELVNGIPGLGAKYAYVSAKWLGVAQPTGLGFQYRPFSAGDNAWVTVTGADVYVDAAQKSFRGLLKGLSPGTLYEFRPIGDNLTPGSTAVFMTDVLGELPNLDFEGGEYGSFDGSDGVYSPNIPGQSRFWASGNPGSMYKVPVIGVGLKKNVTLPVTGNEARTGTALWMTSYYVNMANVSSLATGTIFSGTFGPITSAPTNSDAQRALVHYGQPYTGRPLALKGWYRYVPKNIDTDIDGKFGSLMGQPDKCKVYISLEVWGAGVNSRPAADKRKVVGYGELLSGATPAVADNNGYVPFEFRIEYDPNNVVKPDHIVMVATCSYLSDDFCGGAGSALYIDDFELIWDPDQLSGN